MTDAHREVCSLCGGDQTAPVVAHWQMVIGRPPPSANDRHVNEGFARHDYKRVRAMWLLEVRNLRLRHQVPRAVQRRRAIFTRCFTGRERAYDYGNFVGGLKVILDAMVWEGLLVGDRPDQLEDYYRQQRHPTTSALLIHLFDFPEGTAPCMIPGERGGDGPGSGSRRGSKSRRIAGSTP